MRKNPSLALGAVMLSLTLTMPASAANLNNGIALNGIALNGINANGLKQTGATSSNKNLNRLQSSQPMQGIALEEVKLSMPR